MAAHSKFTGVFQQLKQILVPYASEMLVKADSDEHYYLDTHKIYPKNKLPVFFGSVKIGKNYVSFHLMPVYACPSLLENMTDELKKRMQGKSCFNFKQEIEPAVIDELTDITARGYRYYKDNGLLS